MTKLEEASYTAKAHTTGDRQNGTSRTSRSSDGHMDIRLSTPGSVGSRTNLEQLIKLSV